MHLHVLVATARVTRTGVVSRAALLAVHPTLSSCVETVNLRRRERRLGPARRLCVWVYVDVLASARNQMRGQPAVGNQEVTIVSTEVTIVST